MAQILGELQPIILFSSHTSLHVQLKKFGVLSKLTHIGKQMFMFVDEK